MPLLLTHRGSFNVAIDGAPDAPPVIMAHPLGGSLAVWAAQAQALVGEFRVIRYDARGHGATPTPPHAEADAERDGVAALGKDALAIMDTLEITQAHWCGLSMGGMVGQWLLAKAPERLSRVVLANTSATTGPAEAWSDRLATLKSDGVAGLIDGIMTRWFTPAFAQAHPETVADVRNMVLQTSPEGYAACAMALRGMDLQAAIQGATPPTLVISGMHDLGTTPDQARQIANALADARLITLEAAHLSNVEQADAFTAAVVAFYRG